MKRIIFSFLITLLATFAFSDVKVEIISGETRASRNPYYDMEYKIPDAPEGYHLIGIETIYAYSYNMESIFSYGTSEKIYIKRIYYYSNDSDNHSFSLSSSVLPYPYHKD